MARSQLKEYAHAVDLGLRVRQPRQRAGLTQPELAERAGTSVRAVRDIEAQRVARPRASSVERLAAALALSAAERAELHLAGRVEDTGVRVNILGPLEVRHDGRRRRP